MQVQALVMVGMLGVGSSLAACAQCDEDEVREGGRCITACNTAQECSSREQCVDGRCVLADAGVSGSGSTGGTSTSSVSTTSGSSWTGSGSSGNASSSTATSVPISSSASASSAGSTSLPAVSSSSAGSGGSLSSNSSSSASGTPIPKDAVVLVDESRLTFVTVAMDWQLFADDLRGDGHTVNVLTQGPLSATTLAGVDILVLSTTWQPFLPAELDAVVAFVLSGGSLFVTGLGWSWRQASAANTLENYPMNLVAQRFGFRFLDGFIEDPTHQVRTSREPLFHITGNHPILAGVVVVGGPVTPSPLQALSAGVDVVISGDDDAYATGWFTAGQHPPLLVATTYGQGRVVGLAHEGYFALTDFDNNGTANILDHDNRTLGRNVIQFLAGWQ